MTETVRVRHNPLLATLEIIKALIILSCGDLVYLPTEFLHGLYDGGMGAGLDDFWNAMRASKVSAGGFLWSSPTKACCAMI
jgi:hypothetical protein